MLVVALPWTAAAQHPATLDVWPGEAPGETREVGPEKLEPAGADGIARLSNVTRPQITVYRPPKEKETGAAVVICPGGGYHILAIEHEGKMVAEWLNSIGVTGVILKYRVPRRQGKPKHLPPLQDAQRAMSLVRAKAAQWNIDPKRIGILGFSAGGHLTAAASTNFDRRAYPPVDEIDKVSCRPDFAVLVYPAYLFDGEDLSEEIRPSDATPPCFFAHAADDRISPKNSIRMFLALRDNNVPAELHIYDSGGHGFGMLKSDKPCSTWPARCEAWMRARGILAE